MNINTLRQHRATAYAEMEAAMALTDAMERQAAFDTAATRVEEMDADIARAERIQRLKGEGAVAGTGDPGGQPNSFMAKWSDSLPRSSHDLRPGQTLTEAQTLAFGDLLAAVYRADRGRGVDERLIGAVSGGAEAVPSDAGYLVEKDIADGLLRRTFDNAMIAGRARRIPISGGSNGLKINALKDNSRASGSRWGGVTGYWNTEGGTYTPSRPRMRQMKLELKKLTGLMYATDEMMQDAAALASIMAEAFPEEFAFLLDNAMFEGDGASEPLGFKNAGCKVTVAKEAGQAAATIEFENITKMWARTPARSAARAEWWINQDTLPKLMAMTQVIGTGGVPVFLPPGGLSQSPYGSLLGRPVIPMEHCETAGTEGDIVLCDPSQYVVIDKGNIQYASSIHVAFLTGEQAFRFTYRVDGQPVDDLPITPFKGTDTLSSFITLATRA